jgi:hypothetical protein
MELKKKNPVYLLPSYSLTSDLLGFLRCGLQYRYSSLGKMPPLRPVQLWFGQFIHGIMDEGFRRYKVATTQGIGTAPPWSDEEVAAIVDLVQKRLSAQGLRARNRDVEELGRFRAERALNELGPCLFPLIYRSEIRLTGTRDLLIDAIPPAYRFREITRYEMAGIVDVLSHIQLEDPKLSENPIVKILKEELGEHLPDEFEVIIDYKGMRRSPTRAQSPGAYPTLWESYGWQVQTYAHLRTVQADSFPVVAGIILYLNELYPVASDLEELKAEIQNRSTDLPVPGSTEEGTILSWTSRDPLPDLPFEFRLHRAMRIEPVTETSIQTALGAFDDVVARIETCRGKELCDARILSSWDPNPLDEPTCRACDVRSFCTVYGGQNSPPIPGVKKS